MRSRLSRLLRIAPYSELRPTSFANSFRAEEREAALTTTAVETESVGHDAELTAHDEAIFLLHTAAEVEHSLMVQYLYAAYSLDSEQVPPDKKTLIEEWRREILLVAKEEMGHLASVQNLLHLIGGSLNLEREDFPFRNELYPFRFRLEPLTKNSLAKYVFAEMPADLTGDDVDEIKRRANQANMQNPVNHVGLLYEAIADVFRRQNAGGNFALTDLLADSEPYQAGEDWTAGSPTFVLNTVTTREAAIKLIEDIAEQGEGATGAAENAADSHYHKLRRIYDAFPEAGDWQPALKLPSNPNTTFSPDPDASMEKDLQDGRITNQKTRLWAQLFNLRYRMLLMDIFHALHLKSNVAPDGDNRNLLLNWAFQEMFLSIKTLSRILAALPLRDGGGAGGASPPAGPPFELPYALSLPAMEQNRWRLHRDMISASQMLTQRILAEADPIDEQIEFLNGLAAIDKDALAKAEERIRAISPAEPGSGNNPDVPPPVNPPGEPNMNRFTEVKTILENSVAGDDIGAHGNFWRDKTRDEFVVVRIFGQLLFARKADGTFDENESVLVKALQGRSPFGADIGTPNASFRRMPVGRPPVAPDKITFIQTWIKDGCPDDAPQITALGFAADIKNMFRAAPDRSAMLAIAQFDLHKFEDVRDHADGILERLEDGSMPCDGGWSAERIAKFRQWIADGKQP